jgi:hydroxymethylbilane synthase
MHIKIGSRKSKLALWQAEHVANKLVTLGHSFELVLMESEGDKILDTPLPLIGGKGVFTKCLDEAILNNSIDIAVHSCKDIPTELEENLFIAAILERENPTDALVTKNGIDFLAQKHATIATSSNRRKAQWLSKYPEHTIVDIRGNVPTRIQKLKNSNWDATILASAGLIRLELEHEISEELNWMLSAPAQGAVAVICNKENSVTKEIISQLNHDKTAKCVHLERDFLNELSGGCSAPVGAFVTIENDTVYFKGVVLSNDGKEKIEINLEARSNASDNLGRKAAQIALSKGALKLIETANHEKYS